jgi:hypothetical protein
MVLLFSKLLICAFACRANAQTSNKKQSIIIATRSVVYATLGVRMAQKRDTTEDLRVQRTRKLLQQALIELTVEKGFAAITVRDITKRAMVNRSTFYRHYLDKFDLLEQYMNELFGLTSEEAFI